MHVHLRKVINDDLPIFFEHQLDPEALRMAAFTPKDPSNWNDFKNHWEKILSNNLITARTIIFNENVVGNMIQFEQFDEPEICYWIGKEYWGKGIASQALLVFLKNIKTRPLFARAAKDNIGSLKVLEKCGFEIMSEDKGFSNARGEIVGEFILKLE